MSDPRKIFLIAGEASGDIHGAELVTALRKVMPGVQIHGAGGKRMQKAGMYLVLNLVDHAVLGLVEVLKNYGKFKGFFDELLQKVESFQPDAVIFIDYPGFNLRFAAALRKRMKLNPQLQPKLIYYISPQVWAWKTGRIWQMERDLHLMLTIFPFEKAVFAPTKLPVEFVGHPMLDRLAKEVIYPEPLRDKNLLALLPGSREREVSKILPALLGSFRILKEKFPNLRAAIPAASSQLKSLIEQMISRDCMDLKPSIMVKDGGASEILQRAWVGVVASGTTTMECAYFGMPMIVVYKVAPMTYYAGRAVVKVRHLAMVNILAEKEIVPELLQSRCRATDIAAETLKFLENEKLCKEQRRDLSEVIRKLGDPGASDRAAERIKKELGP